MSTLTLPAADRTTLPAHNFNPTVHHYYKGRDIDRAQLTGESITALCGDTGRVSAGATGRLSNGVLVVCPMCSLAHSELPQKTRK